VHERCYADRLLYASPKKKPRHEEARQGLASRFMRIVGRK